MAEKWQEYIKRLGVCENEIRLAIREFRAYKRLVFKHHYEKERSPYLTRIFATNPNQLLDKIDQFQKKIEFCKLKISYYKLVTTEGETFENRIELASLSQKCNKMLNKYAFLQSW